MTRKRYHLALIVYLFATALGGAMAFLLGLSQGANAAFIGAAPAPRHAAIERRAPSLVRADRPVCARPDACASANSAARPSPVQSALAAHIFAAPSRKPLPPAKTPASRTPAPEEEPFDLAVALSPRDASLGRAAGAGPAQGFTPPGPGLLIPGFAPGTPGAPDVADRPPPAPEHPLVEAPTPPTLETPAVVPLPGALPLMASGLAGLLFAGRGKRVRR